MPDWRSTQELQKDAAAFSNLIHSLLGLYAFEWFISLDFDWDIITGKKRFRWPMIFYFANRYLLLFAMIGIVISLDMTTEFNCQALYTFNQLAGNAAVGLASINLSIRTMAVWSQNRYIIGILVVIILGHWSLILQGILLTVTWVPGVGCTIIKTNNTILAATFIYSMCFDLTVLILNAYKLGGVNSANRVLGTSRIAKMIFEDGLIFFIIAFVANLIATVFMCLNLNQIMSVIFNVPAAVASTIVACRVVRRLTNFANTGPEVYTSSYSGNNVNFRGNQVSGGVRGMTNIQSFKHTRSGVHVQMETFTQAEDARSQGADYEAKGDTTPPSFQLDVEAKGEPL